MAKKTTKEDLAAQMGDFFNPFGTLTAGIVAQQDPEPKAATTVERATPRMKGGRKDKPVCVAIDEDLMQKIRVIIYRESSPTVKVTLKEIVDSALEVYVRKYEAQHGAID